jgi:hypothetical protein
MNSVPISPQDTTQTAFCVEPNSSTLSTENLVFEYLSQSSIPEPALNPYASSDTFYEGHWRSAHPVHPINYASLGYLISEANPVPSAQSAFYPQFALLKPKTKPCSQPLNHDLSFLPPDVQWIIRKRIEGMQWGDIEEGHKKRWSNVKANTLCGKIQRVRDKHHIINHILPPRQAQLTHVPPKLYRCPMGCWYYV